VIYQIRSSEIQWSVSPSWSPHTDTVWISGEPVRVLQDFDHGEPRLYHIQVAARMEEFYEALGRFRKRLLIFAPLALLLRGLGYWMSRRALARWTKLLERAEN